MAKGKTTPQAGNKPPATTASKMTKPPAGNKAAEPKPAPAAAAARPKAQGPRVDADEEEAATSSMANPTRKAAAAKGKGKPIPKAKPRAGAAAESAPLRQFQLNFDAATHHEADGTVIEPGEVLETGTDMVATYPNKWREVKDGKYVGDHEIPPPKKRTNADNTLKDDATGEVHGPDADEEGNEVDEEGKAVEGEEGQEAAETERFEEEAEETDVTEELFPDATELGVKVYALPDGGGYEVRGEDGKPLNTEPLGTKEDVNRFLDTGETEGQQK